MTTNNTSAASAAHAQHTPGPWTVDGSYIHGPNGKRFLAVAGDGEGQANARLIAAAPELLIILKNALGSLEACEIILQPKTERARLSADIRDARAAIAKAEGRA